MNVKLTRNEVFALGVCYGISIGMITTAIFYKRIPREMLFITPEQIKTISENLDQCMVWDSAKGVIRLRVLAEQI